MRLYLGDDFLGRLTIRIPVFARGRRTGVPVDSLVSYEKENPPTLKALDAGI